MLQQFAEPLAICGGDQFKGRAYEKAARAVAGYHREIAAWNRGMPRASR
jgi:DNA polymerase (family X)